MHQVSVGKNILLKSARAQPPPERSVIAGPHQSFGQPWDLKKEHVPAAGELPDIRSKMFLEHRQMRTIEHNQPLHYVWPRQGGGPCDTAAPIVTHDDRFFLSVR